MDGLSLGVTRIRAHEPAASQGRAGAHGTADGIALSFIRTVTVGFGLEPNLLTPAHREEGRALAG